MSNFSTYINENKTNITKSLFACKYHTESVDYFFFIYSDKKLKFVKHLNHSIFMLNSTVMILLSIALINWQLVSMKIKQISIKIFSVQLSCKFFGLLLLHRLWQNTEICKNINNTIFLLNNKAILILSISLRN